MDLDKAHQRDQFDDLLLGTKRSGIENLLEWLHQTDFYTAPASTRFHGSYEGGLLEHSLEVFDHLGLLLSTYGDNDMLISGIMKGSAVICALLHDVCKANFYGTEMRNKKIDGRWEKVPVYVVQDAMPLGHGEKSVILVQRHIDLSDDEALAIRWHMGGFDEAARGGFGGANAMSAAYGKCQLAVLLHMADLAATYINDHDEEDA